MLDKTCQKIQRNIGLDCFFFAKLFMWIALIYSILSPFIRYYIDFHVRDSALGFVTWLLVTPITSGIFTLITSMLCLVRLFGKINSIAEIEKSVKTRIEQGLKNSRFFQIRPGYLISIGFFTMTIVTLIIFSIFPAGKNQLTCTSIYGLKSFYPYYIAMAFCACNPLPPKKSKLLLWYEKMRERFVREQDTGAIPQPA